MNNVQFVNRLMMLVIAPFIGIFIGIVLLTSSKTVEQDIASATSLELSDGKAYHAAAEALAASTDLAKVTRNNIEASYAKYNETNELVSSLIPVVKKTLDYPYAIYDKAISEKLGKPSATINSNKLKAQLYYKSYDHFKGYLVKIKLKSSSAVDMVLGGDELGKAMTTVEAAKKHGAAVAVNAGGFADAGSKRYPLGTTIIDGSYVNGFHPSTNNLFFAGLNEQNELIGGIFKEKEQLDKLKPRFGASFVPILLQDGKKKTIPAKWKTSPKRAPRVVLANFRDDQLLLFVTDGYNTDGSAGATLAEIQSILVQYDVQDAYNMDGGGSASLVFNGQLINSPSDGQLRKLPTHLLFFK
ncbi:phosphodiester glycosidase family protein [Paenibacillus septentrionalis]|uniref:Phosphodiester glycosidase family protein n=1 Tax=Paenibacillus septentrionalis TaxID=429342 RepID=A0ABW1V1S3_9BACL